MILELQFRAKTLQLQLNPQNPTVRKNTQKIKGEEREKDQGEGGKGKEEGERRKRVLVVINFGAAFIQASILFHL